MSSRKGSQDDHQCEFVEAADEWDKDHELIDEGELEDLIRPETNSGFKLWIYNRIDTTRYNKQIVKKRKKYNKKIKKRKAKEDKINAKRIRKAKKKGNPKKLLHVLVF